MAKPANKKGVEFKGERTKVLVCHCTNQFQDSKYGARRRLHNRCMFNKNPGWRCSVCDAEKPDA